MVAKGEGVGRGMEWEVGWINNQVLLYGTGNYIQYPVINHNGKEYLKKNIYIRVTESLCCTAVFNTKL